MHALNISVSTLSSVPHSLPLPPPISCFLLRPLTCHPLHRSSPSPPHPVAPFSPRCISSLSPPLPPVLSSPWKVPPSVFFFSPLPRSPFGSIPCSCSTCTHGTRWKETSW